MRAGAAYDLLFGVAILFASGPAAEVLGLGLPADPVYLRLNGVFLLLLAGLYLLPGIAPQRYQGVVAVGAVGRLLGFFYLGWVWLAGQPPVFLALALGDLAFAALHTALLVAARRLTGVEEVRNLTS